MVHLYSQKVQNCCVELGLITHNKIKRYFILFKIICIPGYITYVLLSAYLINGFKRFLKGFWQLLVILSIINLFDQLLIDNFLVGHTNAWIIPGTENLKQYITKKDKCKKWLFGTVGMAIISAILSGLMTIFIN